MQMSVACILRLMDGAKDLLAGGGKFAQEAYNIIGALAIETTGRLVEEEQELWLSSELDAYSHPFSS